MDEERRKLEAEMAAARKAKEEMEREMERMKREQATAPTRKQSMQTRRRSIELMQKSKEKIVAAQALAKGANEPPPVPKKFGGKGASANEPPPVPMKFKKKGDGPAAVSRQPSTAVPSAGDPLRNSATFPQAALARNRTNP